MATVCATVHSANIAARFCNLESVSRISKKMVVAPLLPGKQSLPPFANLLGRIASTSDVNRI